MKNIFTVLFTTASLFAFAGKVTINGKAPDYPNRKITAYRYADYVSMRMEKIVSAEIPEDGNFVLRYESAKTEEILLKIDGTRALMYTQPDATYFIQFPGLAKDAVKSFSNNEVELLFDTLDVYDINNLILDFESRMDDFIGYYYPIMGSQAYHDEIDTLKEYLSKVYAKVDNPYFKQYVFYSVASVEQIGGLNVDLFKLKTLLYASYLYKHDILYHHPKYMLFFNQFYTDVFKLADGKEEASLSKAINYKKSLSMTKDILKQDQFMKDDKICELVLIKALGEEYYSFNYYQDNIIFILDSVRDHSSYPEHRVIADNMIYKLTALSVGYPAPKFTLESNKQQQVSLSDFKGKYVYLHFWASWNTGSIPEMKIMTELNKKYGRDIQFVSINMDEDTQSWMTFLKVHPEMNWTHLHYGGQPSLIDEYQIVSLSQYFLIGPDGNMIQSPAYRPTPHGANNTTIEDTFFEIWRRLHPNSKMEK